MSKTINLTRVAAYYAAIVQEMGSALVPQDLISQVRANFREQKKVLEMGALCVNELGDVVGRYVYFKPEY